MFTISNLLPLERRSALYVAKTFTLPPDAQSFRQTLEKTFRAKQLSPPALGEIQRPLVLRKLSYSPLFLKRKYLEQALNNPEHSYDQWELKLLAKNMLEEYNHLGRILELSPEFYFCHYSSDTHAYRMKWMSVSAECNHNGSSMVIVN